MELTYNIAQKMIRERIEQYPAVWRLVADPAFDANLQKILDFERVDASLLEQVRFETLIILTVYAPLNEFAENIAESTGLSPEQSESIAESIKTLIFSSEVLEDLLRAQIYWEAQEQENPGDAETDGRVAALRQSLDKVPTSQTPTVEPQWGTVGERESVSPAQASPAPVVGTVPDADASLRDALTLKPRTVEKIVERTVPAPNTKPLTREELLHALAAKRTLQSDAATLDQH